MHSVHVLFRSPAVRIVDYRCRAGRSACGPEEAAGECDVVFVRTGVFVRHDGGRRVVGDANQVLFFNRDEGYRVSHPADGGDECTVISLSSALLRDVAASVDPRASESATVRFDATHAPTTTDADLLHRRLFRALRANRAERLAVEEASLELVGQALRLARGASGMRGDRVDAARRRHRDLVENAKQVVAARYAEPVGLEELASAVGCSPFHLSRVFRREVGVPVHRYQTRLRVRTALARILEGERNLTSLALDVGFADHAHFSNTFRRVLGFAPSRGRDLPELVRASKNLRA